MSNPNPQPKSVSVDLDGRAITIETGKLAKQAGGACVVRLGDTVVLATVCSSDPRPGLNFFPLTVEYKENTYAGGMIPGGFFKREGRPTEKEILTCRLIDRPLRPLFPNGFRNDTQIIIPVLSADGENDPDVLAINAASAALAVSDIPFADPVGAVRLGLIDGRLVLNPTHKEREASSLDLVVAATEHAVVMVEAGANELPESVLLDAIFHGHEACKRIVAVQRDLARQVGAQKAVFVPPVDFRPELLAPTRERFGARLSEALLTRGKHQRQDALDDVKRDLIAALLENVPSDQTALRTTEAAAVFNALEVEIFRSLALEKGQRVDGRRFDEVRPIDCEVGQLPRTHGSALFTRGETQALVTATLGTPEESQIIEQYDEESRRHFLLHYNFPPFSVGETRPMRGTSRREIGHGNLARRAIESVVPDQVAFPYTIRVVSDILESNGSSSMATVCGASMALMDAGIPIRTAVAGVAMGLIKDGGRHAVLTDIAGIEDHEGDMDFKVAGSRTGVTALQMDIKIAGIDRAIMTQALEQARVGRLHILEKMETAIRSARQDLSPYAPRIETILIPVDKIRDIIGPGGKMIRKITTETGAKIEVDDSGRVLVASSDKSSRDKAIEWIKGLTASPEIGRIYSGPVKRVEDYGAFVEILPGQDGLLHVSEMTTYRLRSVRDLLKEGDNVEVKVVDVDPGTGKIRLSRKALLIDRGIVEQPPEGQELVMESAPQGREDRGPRRDGDRGGRGGGRGGFGRR